MKGQFERVENAYTRPRTACLDVHDLTKLFAGVASRARQIFGMKADQVHVDTTSFSVSGEYVDAAPRAKELGEAEEPAALIAITYGYSRDHRDDLKQWMLARASTHEGDIPLFLQPLDGNSSDKVSLLSTISTIQMQLREVGESGLGDLDLSPERSCAKAARPGSMRRMEPCTGLAA